MRTTIRIFIKALIPSLLVWLFHLAHEHYLLIFEQDFISHTSPDPHEFIATHDLIFFPVAFVIGFVITLIHHRMLISQEKLRQSELRYRSLADATREAIFIHDGNTILDVNNAACNLLKTSREKLIGTNPLDYVFPDDRELVSTNVKNKSLEPYRLRLITSENQTVWIESQARQAVYKGEEVRITAVMDLTEKLKAEEILKASEQKYQSMLNDFPVTVFEIDSNGILTYVNPEGFKVFQVSQEDFDENTSAFSFIAEKDRERAMENAIKIFIENVPFTAEYDMMKSSGEIFSALVHSIPIVENNMVIGIRGIIFDITDRKTMEEEIREKNAVLQAAEAARTEFISMISHELRSPLVPILGYSELILNGTFGVIPFEFREPVETIYERADALTRLIEDLLLLSRVERKALKIDIAEVEVYSLIESIIKSYQLVDYGKPVQINLSGHSAGILADPYRFGQVIQNLLNNSIKYSGNTVNIDVSVETEDDFVKVFVRDNGIGISSDHLPFIFDRFFQAESGDTRHHQGSGLGLAICKDLIELMNGTISAESTLGKGSVFTLTIPSCKNNSFSDILDPFKLAEAELSKSNIPEHLTSTAKKSITIIDDDAVTLNLLALVLKDDYIVQTFSNPDDGLKSFSDKIPDLLLLDWMMPSVDGLTLLKKIKENKNTSNIPVIFISGKAEAESVKKALESGALDFITKPFRKDDLLNKVRKYLTLIQLNPAINQPDEESQSAISGIELITPQG